MQLAAARKSKLDGAKTILSALGLPPGQCNDRSAWVFLALANLNPEEPWGNAEAPLLPTVEIMEFIRKQYGKDYKPNSRETIRRQTLHQFEQAQLVDRNRDNPARATNSKDNNYSLNELILEIIRSFPDQGWEIKVNNFINSAGELKLHYEKRLELNKIPVTLLDGSKIMLSPGEHNQLHADILHEFCPRFIGAGGKILYVGDTASSRNEGGKLLVLESDYLKSLGVSAMSHEKLPDIVIYDEIRKWLFLIEAVTSHGPVSPKRWNELEKIMTGCSVGRVYVTAFANNSGFKKYIADIAWETEVWIAASPDHLIHFNGDRFLGPR
jgi:adenine-specific DNA-methyltransferase